MPAPCKPSVFLLSPLLFLCVTAAHSSPPARVVIPAGAFTQGSEAEPDAPVRTVKLAVYSIAQHEVTVDEFTRFVDEGGYRRTELWSEDGRAWLAQHPGGAGADLRAAGRAGDHPVVSVTWFEADAWCRWAGGRLPTEAEWERAACGTDGRRFPWGDDDSVAAQWYAGGKFGDVSAVSTVAASQQKSSLQTPDGLKHMSGNVWEWTADRYHRRDWGGTGNTDPISSANTPWRVLRGGSYMNLPSYCSCRHREPARPDRVALTTGFRCVWEGP